IPKVGIQKSGDFFVIALGSKIFLKKLSQELIPVSKSFQFSHQNSKFLKREFKITEKQIDSVQSKTPLEDLLCEKSAILFG
ncbi:MAG: thiamine biosynthesis protein ThiS, partial [Nitrosopumilus sp.]|nr:thiamine biosynthesis protein ThiS [Nitrosopumilus sp.]